MPRVGFFQRRGFYASRRFLDDALCDRIRREISTSTGKYGLVGDGNTAGVDRRMRNVVQSDVSMRIQGLVRRRIEALLPRLERRYGVRLDGGVDLVFLRYLPGGFHKPHTDRSRQEKGEMEWLRRRRVSLVIFLNDQADERRRGSYAGGSLLMFDIFKDGDWARLPVPLQGKKGLLFSFPSDTLHAVAPVTRGERFAIAAWCMGKT